ncbi:putative (di)nucleoside polyphosphate hydrolase [Bathymodiolus platifrons methanotrophic gill symbiont]|uniref:RNA pyrophosphohydrolase n=1 Tax=Bathymodiolus platifrons methanotrophic gill symbiont TaxID=113268 RepID=UPI000B415A9C|nr:RNA pyrophosphohydrolase [Bathymodiolus platifrons methanotrophic gill symbiont]MCK5870696.1 RNA pyrophosphohydrolase [Methyloprofundus sp.]TXK98607.1 RNA pyrophosphohydrolase [Methylococcaceae bacterium CS4]TXL00586.1 RNA pyrophosphohydrolase [Methylococcaceae bacterium CS5]TXL01622.1 RNA pyrophosphohydrolase [Methylococcaceae bacterium HT1]TXL05933.1 RNA pyrophosphohydrolase [Methylococcaceae bacterium CS3]TXL07913.1 RNA pyrophosphohydrolase [Methylococcaceae bacterium CS1]TXL11540.1 RN
MIDSKGYRSNVGIILCNAQGHVFWAKRSRVNSWQFPQGGMEEGEAPEQAMFRELLEETGLDAKHVQIIGRTRYWLRYRLPEKYIRRHSLPLCIGQKQIWYLLKLVGDETNVSLNRHNKPEFDDWQWVEFWEPLKSVVFFKRKVYRRAMMELGAHLLLDSVNISSASYLSNENMSEHQ